MCGTKYEEELEEDKEKRLEREIPAEPLVSKPVAKHKVRILQPEIKGKEIAGIELLKKEVECQEIPIVSVPDKYKARAKEKHKEIVKRVPKIELSPIEIELRDKYEILASPAPQTIEVKSLRSKIEVAEVPRVSITRSYEAIILKEKEKAEIKTLRVEKQAAVKEVGEGHGIGKEPENVIDKLFTPIAGTGILEWDITKVICVLTEEKEGRRILEDVISSKYLFQGFYHFFKRLPWIPVDKRIEFNKQTVISPLHDRDVLTNPNILLVGDAVSPDEAGTLVTRVREISQAGSKCLILYNKSSEELENIQDKIEEIFSLEVCRISLPEKNEETKKLIAQLLGISPYSLQGETLDKIWYDGLKVCEEKQKRLDEELPHVKYCQERETYLHYLLKRLVYNWLKKEFPHAEITVEDPIKIDEKGEITQVIPDITATINGKIEYWEVETGYPSKEEVEIIEDYAKPFTRLSWKLEKYLETKSVKEGTVVKVVLQPIYIYLFKKDLSQLKEYFKEKIRLKFYTIDWENGIVKGVW